MLGYYNPYITGIAISKYFKKVNVVKGHVRMYCIEKYVPFPFQSYSLVGLIVKTFEECYRIHDDQ